MALRVLLADESTTIKKVMQLALQDFAVEVKSVQAGIDVVEVSRTFGPDIIFADVLLQKKNGYEVCSDLKQDPQLNGIPVVLMWSSFMELDEQQTLDAGADGRLEKPFDVENLRKVVLDLVPKTRSQRLAHFLQFPSNATEPLRSEEATKAENAATQMALPVTLTPEVPASRSWNMDSFDAISDLVPSSVATSDPDDEPWSHQDISRFKVDLPPVSVQDDELDLNLEVSDETTDRFRVPVEPSVPDSADLIHEYELSNEDGDAGENIELSTEPDDRDSADAQRAGEMPGANLELTDFEPEDASSIGSGIPQLSSDRLEEIIRAQSREIIETVVRRVVPDLASDIIRQELQRLLEDTQLRGDKRQ